MLLVLISLLPIPFYLRRSKASNTIVSGNCEYAFNSTSSLCVQNTIDTNVVFTVSSGSFNGSGSILATEDSGIISYYSTSETILSAQCSRTDTTLEVQGGTIAESEGVYVITIPAATSIVISWVIPIAPLFPLMFCIGMIGLGALLFGSTYGIYQMQQGKKLEGFVSAVVIMTIGFALTVAWLVG